MRAGPAHLELLREGDELRLHVRLLLGRHRRQRGRRLLQLLLPRSDLCEALLRGCQAALQVSDLCGARVVGARRGRGARRAADVQHPFEHPLELAVPRVAHLAAARLASADVL